MSVKYSLSAFRRAKFVGGGGAVQFATDADPTVALETFRAAARAAEEPYAAAGMDGEDFVASSSYSPAPDGPIGYIHLCDNADLMAAWLSSVSELLESQGLAGELRIVKSVRGPRLNAPTAVAGITMCPEYDEMMATPLEWDNLPVRWWVSPERTARIIPQLVAWCLDTPGEVFVQAGVGLRLDPGAVEELVLGALSADTMVRVVRASDDATHHRYLRCHFDGSVLFGVRDEHLSWAEQVQLLEVPIRAVAPDAVHAMVRLGPPVIELSRLWKIPPASPYVDKGGRISLRLWPLAHLQPDYVPDAYLTQVMTSSQLDKINATGGLPPDRWKVEDLGSERHLVTARDQTPWLALDPAPYQEGEGYRSRTAVPDPGTLAQAREDFAPALLTYQLHQDHPSPLTSER